MVLSDDNPWIVNNHYRDNIQRQSDSHSCAFFTCWYAYQLAIGGSVGTWPTNIHWPSRVKDISTDVMISLVSRTLSIGDYGVTGT